MKIEVSEATNLQLDWLVAKCQGREAAQIKANGPVHLFQTVGYIPTAYQPSTDWAQGGPIIEREKIELRYHDVIVAGIWYRDNIGSDECLHKAIGPTTLTAAMRCFVTSKLGDEVEVPDTLI